MARIDRRHFLRNTGLALAGLAGLPRALRAELDRKLRITEIEAHNVAPPLHDFNAEELFRYHGYSVLERVVFIVKTAGGLEGYGESGIGYDPERFKKYLDTSPFDWIAEEENLPINMAIYDLMGKYLGVPSWKLIGSQSRSWVPIAAWTVSRSPEAMAEEVVNNARRGYRWLKYHVDVLQNAVDQTEAMQKVAPKGFKVHYDFNEDSNLEAVYPVLRELERFPIDVSKTRSATRIKMATDC
ncbi:MAG: hypothetical protein MK538_06870 [Planctomycetes bacterium]|nr:hypothetical protein [Planctomycetota bacterium]